MSGRQHQWRTSNRITGYLRADRDTLDVPEISSKSSDVDSEPPGLWDVTIYLGAVVLSVAIGAACICAAIAANHPTGE